VRSDQLPSAGIRTDDRPGRSINSHPSSTEHQHSQPQAGLTPSTAMLYHRNDGRCARQETVKLIVAMRRISGVRDIERLLS
jgi:hypothetical protein